MEDKQPAHEIQIYQGCPLRWGHGSHQGPGNLQATVAKLLEPVAAAEIVGAIVICIT